MTYRTDFERDNHILKEQGAGAFGIVYASIPKDIASRILAEVRDPSNPLSLLTAKTQLRAAVGAAKISKRGTKMVTRGNRSQGRKEFQREVESLQALSEGKYPNIVSLQTADLSEYGSLILEPLAGGDLTKVRGIKRGGPSSPGPVGLAWHFIYELSNALLALHTREFAHMDLSERNIMLRLPGSFRDYPDVVVVDFGMVTSYRKWLTTFDSDTADTPTRRHEFLGLYVRDLKRLHFPLQNSFDRAARNHAPLFDALVSIKDYRARKGATAEEHYVKFVEQLRDVAMQGRKNEYKVLPEALAAYLKEREYIVSDEDLETAFPELKPAERYDMRSR